MEIVVNRCYGGFQLSRKAYEFLGLEWDGYGYAYSDDRTNPKLVDCVLTLGPEASGFYAQLVVVYVPDDVEWEIRDYDGIETVEEKHRSW